MKVNIILNKEQIRSEDYERIFQDATEWTILQMWEIDPLATLYPFDYHFACKVQPVNDEMDAYPLTPIANGILNVMKDKNRLLN